MRAGGMPDAQGWSGAPAPHSDECHLRLPEMCLLLIYPLLWTSALQQTRDLCGNTWESLIADELLANALVTRDLAYVTITRAASGLFLACPHFFRLASITTSHREKALRYPLIVACRLYHSSRRWIGVLGVSHMCWPAPAHLSDPSSNTCERLSRGGASTGIEPKR